MYKTSTIIQTVEGISYCTCIAGGMKGASELCSCCGVPRCVSVPQAISACDHATRNQSGLILGQANVEVNGTAMATLINEFGGEACHSRPPHQPLLLLLLTLLLRLSRMPS